VTVTSPATSVAALLPLVAATGLPGSLLDWPAGPLPDERFDQLVTESGGQGAGRGLSGLLHEAVVSGALPATDPQRASVARHHEDDLARSASVSDELVEIVDESELEGLHVRVLGDVVNAHLDYPRPELRPWRDVHLLAESAACAAVEQVVLGRGFRRSGRHLRPDFASRYSDSVRYRRPDGPAVFVHRTLVDGPYGIRIGDDGLWDAPAQVFVGDRLLHTLRPELRLLHLTCAVVLGGDRSVATLRDIAQLVLHGDYDAHTVRELAAGWQCSAVVAMGISEAWTRLAIADVLALSRWASRYAPTPDELRLVKLYGPRRGYAQRGVAILHELPGVAPKLRFAWSLGVPERSFLAARKTTRSAWILHGVGQLLAGRDPGATAPLTVVERVGPDDPQS
jgi:Uncharacterised nucleotidyltransferase